jgi:hypothetical protein
MLSAWPAERWDLMIRQARRSGLLGRVYWVLSDAGMIDAIPQKARDHLQGGRAVAEHHARSLKVEVQYLYEALGDAGIPLILLKGGAYVAAELGISRGRVFSDIDILVPLDAIAAVEKALMRHGWFSAVEDAYDQHYYRRWMHELPPMRHVSRHSALDVHHTILPPTARVTLDAAMLVAAARPVDGDANLRVLANADMVLHSMAHLFYDGDFVHGLRDIVDADGLLREFSQTPGFWPELVERARQTGLERPLFYGLRNAAQLLETPVPVAAREALERAGPGRPVRALMDSMLARGLAPHHESCADWLTGPALWFLYVRSHYLRMPLGLLLPHLVRKAFKRTSSG